MLYIQKNSFINHLFNGSFILLNAHIYIFFFYYVKCLLLIDLFISKYKIIFMCKFFLFLFYFVHNI